MRPTAGAARPPADVPALADARGRRASTCGLAGVMAVAPLDADPGAAFGRLAEVAARLRGDAPGRRRRLGRDERRPGGGRRPRRDTPARRHGVARFAASAPVASEQRGQYTVAPGRFVHPDRRAVRHGRRDAQRWSTSASSRTRTGYDYDEYDDYDEDGEADGRRPARRPSAARTATAARSRAARGAPRRRRDDAGRDARRRRRLAPFDRITTLHPRTYNEAKQIGESFREGTPVIMNLSDMDDSDAKRLVDFAAGLVFGLRGTIERVTNKVFLLSPADVTVTAEDKARMAESGFFNQS